ncbi:hypothetical protein JCM9492_10980 [Aquifex pyrophilus]
MTTSSLSIETTFYVPETASFGIESVFYVREYPPTARIETNFWFGQKNVPLLVLFEERKARVRLSVSFERRGVLISVERRGKSAIPVRTLFFGIEPLPASYLAYLQELGITT